MPPLIECLEKLEPGTEWPAANTFVNILNTAGLTSPKRKKYRPISNLTLSAHSSN